MTDSPRSLKRNISPPPPRRASKASRHRTTAEDVNNVSAAAVEAGEAHIRNHLEYFCNEHEKVRRPSAQQACHLSIADFRALYMRNQHSRGCHFVIHQHDHPVAGVHYDLRLQFSESSSLSFSIPYGLPGNPNSLRPNRMAIETRVHNLWNNLIESSSHATGSLLIWDTGEYEVRPRNLARKQPETDDEVASNQREEVEEDGMSNLSEPEKLALAFQERHIHLRLHGTRLPQNYTIAMRLPRHNYRRKQPKAPCRRRRHQNLTTVAEKVTSESDEADSGQLSTTEKATESAALKDAAAASEDEGRDALQREQIRVENAYPGATNSIGSVHQRQWFLSLDREASGFVKATKGTDRGRWVREDDHVGTRSGFETFAVMGREVETSVITGRTAMDVMEDGGVKNYMGRKMWRPITE
ncbi:hypothetical protein K461DRAFT_282200 [Myriangium duriaei CBS 260.36]|uniref:DNA ligase D 3'-phosphoesterase domain-containing protein n=1 Tax=Myriangium duriaei CBS 260.36 TaxID=1168546 RepID=A0A9P4IRI8_9PEZI|nr:hypothetical protein K461DRAFT_282200 [Myriangium duriaei CBS 260.36]